ncbi:O-antigen ligase family protein [Erythrobacter sp. NE805]|uniref:O-antigen ligase family protein n=1 Tax=Erythrobacter sp. NE805 TaxID=3389875 RepID=UPI00396B4201
MPATARTRAAHPRLEPFGFERLPVFGLIVAMIVALAAPAFGPLASLVQLLALGAILAMRWRSLPGWLLPALPFLLLPLFAAASALWSEVPGVSARYGVQLLVTVVAGVVLGRALALRDLVLAVFVGLAIACLLGLASGRMGASDAGPVMIGFAGSKNQMGYIALFWMAAALCVAASATYRPLARILAALAVVPAVFLTVQVDSATALVSAVLLAALLAVLAVAAWLGRGGRLFALGAGALLAIPAVLALPLIERQAAILQTDVLGKDERLTGRTLLWEEADRLIAQRPVIGHGYKAIWLGPAGKGLLARNRQRDGRAFHFHDTAREIMADLGIIGLVLFLVPLGLVALRTAVLLIAAVDAPRAFAAASLFLILLRLRTELVIAPFMLDTVLLYAVLAALAAMPLGERAPLPARRALRPMRRAPQHRRPLPQPQRNPA